MEKKLVAHINPSILNANFDDLENEILKISEFSDSLHLDIMDNLFVPNLTFDLQKASEIIAYTPIPVDSHLMIENPDELAPRYAEIGSKSVTFHFEASRNVSETIKGIRANGAKVGIAIKPKTDLDVVAPFFAEIDMLLVMTVEPGFGGQSFMIEQMEKVERARIAINKLSGSDILIQVDGGISESTIAIAAKAGADCFVAGSAVYKSDDPGFMVRKLRALANAEFI
jgi:ribulose-phosphate 3-epimerase